MTFGLMGGKAFVAKKALSTEGEESAPGTGSQEVLLTAVDLPSAEAAALRVGFRDDGIYFLLNEELVFQDIKYVGILGRVSVGVNTKAVIKRITIKRHGIVE